jgi:hypothetical protein
LVPPGEAAPIARAASSIDDAPVAQESKHASEDVAHPAKPSPELEAFLLKLTPKIERALQGIEQVGPKAAQDHAQAIEALRANDTTIDQLEELYETAPDDMHLAKWKIVDLVASMEEPQGLAFLSSVATSPLPEGEEHGAQHHEVSARSQARMIRSRAIFGLSVLAGQGVEGASEVIEKLFRSDDRETVIAAALELHLLGKLGPGHEEQLETHGLKRNFMPVDESFFQVEVPDRKANASAKPLDSEPLDLTSEL